MKTPENEIAKMLDARTIEVKGDIANVVQSELAKSQMPVTGPNNGGGQSMRFRLPWNWNSKTDSDTKMYSIVPMTVLRQMAVAYPIARACINRRVTQITQLKWDITTVDDVKNEDGYKAQIEAVKMFLKTPMGHKTRFREMLTILVDDVLTLDAICFERQRSFKGGILAMVPIDPSTILLRMTEQGATPEPPEPAYSQFIYGKKIADFTTDEMLYESLHSRSYSPYGLAPLESLIIQVESALRGALYNLNYFKEGNTPEGFITLPEDIAMTRDQVEEWQLWFDSIMAGDSKMMRRLKVLPNGSEYTQAKKPEDMAFEKFEMWLLQQTCAAFDVQPQDIGITYQVNKATGDTQVDIGKERGLYPLANFTKEIMDDIIQYDLGFTDLQFMYLDLDPVNRKEEVDNNDKEIRIGVKTIDEVRIEAGYDAIGGNAAKAFVMTGTGPVFVEDIGKPPVLPTPVGPDGKPLPNDNPLDNKDNKDKVDPKEEDKKQSEELKQWRKCVYNDIDAGKPIRTTFKSKHIEEDVYKEISKALGSVHSKTQARLLFSQFLDSEIKTAMKLMDMASEIRSMENEELI